MANPKVVTKPASKSAKKSWKILDDHGKLISHIEIDTPGTYFLAADKQLSTQQTDTDYNLSYKNAQAIINYLNYTQEEVSAILEVNPSTLSRWKKENKQIGKLRSHLIYQMDQVINKGVSIFGSEASFKEWLQTPNFALGDQKPATLLKNPAGIDLVGNALEAMAWGNVM